MAILPLTTIEFEKLTGLRFVCGIEDGLGPWMAVGGLLQSGNHVEFIFYEKRPGIPGIILRTDKDADYSRVLEEVLSLVMLSLEDVTQKGGINDGLLKIGKMAH